MKRQTTLGLGIILLLTFCCYIPVLKAGFTNWDDNLLLTENPLVRSLNINNIKNIFTSTVSELYIPLTILSFALEYHLVQYQPFFYHLTNLLLHLSIIVLSFIFLKKLKVSERACLIAVLLFALHPVHVESVAWITERKDMLYSFFYLSALISYLIYVERNRPAYFVLTIFLGWLSISAKAMAITLPLILLLIDWFQERRAPVIKLLLEKIPFLLYCAPIAYVMQVLNPSTLSVHDEVAKAVLIFLWTFSFYLSKFIFPYPLIPLYKTPEPISLTNPVYLYSALIFMIFLILVIKFRRNRWVMFSCMFYLSSIFLLFRFNKLENLSVVADRFLYLPSLGLTLLCGMGLDYLIKHQTQAVKKSVYISLFVIVMVISILTFQQTQIWKNSYTLWSHELQFESRVIAAYNNRGFYYQEKNNFDAALKDYNQALNINPNYAPAYNNRGKLYAAQKKYDFAKQDFYHAIVLSPTPYAEAYLNLGNLFIETGEAKKAFQHIEQALQINPDLDEAYNSLGKYYDKLNQLDSALSQFNKAICINPTNAVSYNNRGVILSKLKKFDEAVKDLDQATAIEPHYPEPYMNKGFILKSTGNLEGALEQFNLAIHFNQTSASAYNNRGLIYMQKNDLVSALKDFDKAVSLDAKSIESLINRGTLLGKQQRYDQAIEDYSKAIQLSPQPMLFINRGAVYLLNGNIEQALEDFNQVIKTTPNESIAYYYRSICYKRLQQLDQARRDALTAKNLGYANIDAYLKELSP